MGDLEGVRMAVNVLDGEVTRTSIGNYSGSSRVIGVPLVLIALLLSLGISSGLRAQVVGARFPALSLTHLAP